MIDFLSRAEGLFETMQALRRDLHMYPELAFEEVRTAGIVARELREIGLEVKTGVGRTGVVGTLGGSHPGPVLLLRFDMDALPIQEESDVPYVSRNPGVMHACGHDGHTAIGLTVARLLREAWQAPARVPGTIKFAFQPAEERADGALRMIEDGVMESPRVTATLGLHLWNEQPAGWLGIAGGPIMAGAEEFDLELIGKGGHAAIPQNCADPVLAGAQIVTALQSIVSRNVSPLQTAVVSVTSFHGGEAFNVIPPSVHLRGTIRTFEPEVRERVLGRFHEIIQGMAGALGCRAEIRFGSTTPAVINDPDAAALVREAARQSLPDHTIDATAPVTMGAEDYAYFLRQAPGCFFFIGSADRARGLVAKHHHPAFDFDESVLPRGAALMAEAAVRMLRRDS